MRKKIQNGMKWLGSIFLSFLSFIKWLSITNKNYNNLLFSRSTSSDIVQKKTDNAYQEQVIKNEE
jgi:hypothetical protein